MEMFSVSKEAAAFIGFGVLVVSAIQLWLWKTPAPDCCEHSGFNCREGRDCPFRKKKHDDHQQNL